MIEQQLHMPYLDIAKSVSASIAPALPLINLLRLTRGTRSVIIPLKQPLLNKRLSRVKPA